VRVLVIILSLTFCFSRCTSYSEKDFYFNATERKAIEAFKEGDTLYFENPKHGIEMFLVLKFDTSYKKEFGTLMAKPAFNTISVPLKQLPSDSFIHGIFKNEIENRLDTEYHSILDITKYPQSKEVEYFISFKRFMWLGKNGFGILHSDTLRINNCFVKDYYVITDKNISQDSTSKDVSEIIWTINKGIVAYKYNNGEYWTRKNCN
jgi:hypothetical protein